MILEFRLMAKAIEDVRTFYCFVWWHILTEAIYMICDLCVDVLLNSWENCYIESAVLVSIYMYNFI